MYYNVTQFTQCWSNVGPPSATLGQHCTNIGWTSRVCCDSTRCVRIILVYGCRHKPKNKTSLGVNWDMKWTLRTTPANASEQHVMWCCAGKGWSRNECHLSGDSQGELVITAQNWCWQYWLQQQAADGRLGWWRETGGTASVSTMATRPHSGSHVMHTGRVQAREMMLRSNLLKSSREWWIRKISTLSFNLIPANTKPFVQHIYNVV